MIIWQYKNSIYVYYNSINLLLDIDFYRQDNLVDFNFNSAEKTALMRANGQMYGPCMNINSPEMIAKHSKTCACRFIRHTNETFLLLSIPKGIKILIVYF